MAPKKTYEPLQAKSLKEKFIERFEGLILSGEFEIGCRLPPERELARRLEVSRPVIHEGLLELSSRGLVTIVPRKGAFINDYRSEGSLELLVSLLNYHGGAIDRHLLSSLLAMRILFETETAFRAAEYASEEDLAALGEIEDREASCPRNDAEQTARVDFAFHHRIAMASGNLIYPLLMNSFRVLYLDILRRFYRDGSVIDPIFSMHSGIIAHLRAGDAPGARQGMKDLLDFSEKNLYRIFNIEGKADENHD